jgi:hypothetical protein
VQHQPDAVRGFEERPPLRSRRALSTSTSELHLIGTDPERTRTRPNANVDFPDRVPGSRPGMPSGRAPAGLPGAPQSPPVTRAELSTRDSG